RIELLVDPDSPFLELSALAAWGTGFTVGATIVTGIGVISGVECMIIAHDPTVRGGSVNPYSLRKTLRALDIARVTRLPGLHLGGAEMHSRVSGLSDYFAVDELDAIRLGRDIMARINWRKHGPPPGPAADPRYDPDEILGIVSADVKVPFDPREILARVVDGSEFDEYKSLYGTSLVTGWARVHGYPVGVLANHRGVLFS